MGGKRGRSGGGTRLGHRARVAYKGVEGEDEASNNRRPRLGADVKAPYVKLGWS